jgi:hypothetical protein
MDWPENLRIANRLRLLELLQQCRNEMVQLIGLPADKYKDKRPFTSGWRRALNDCANHVQTRSVFARAPGFACQGCAAATGNGLLARSADGKKMALCSEGSDNQAYACCTRFILEQHYKLWQGDRHPAATIP